MFAKELTTICQFFKIEGALTVYLYMFCAFVFNYFPNPFAKSYFFLLGKRLKTFKTCATLEKPKKSFIKLTSFRKRDEYVASRTPLGVESSLQRTY